MNYLVTDLDGKITLHIFAFVLLGVWFRVEQGPSWDIPSRKSCNFKWMLLIYFWWLQEKFSSTRPPHRIKIILMMTFDIWNPLNIFSSKFRVVIMYTSFWRKKKMMPHCRSVNSQNHRSYHSAMWLSRKVFSSLEKERKITLGKPFAQYNKCNLRIQFEFITTTLPAWRRFPAVILN